MTGWYVSHAAFTGTVIRCGPFGTKEEAEKWALEMCGDRYHGDWDVQYVEQVALVLTPHNKSQYSQVVQLFDNPHDAQVQGEPLSEYHNWSLLPVVEGDTLVKWDDPRVKACEY